ncbi:MAG: hypothetical protein KIS66_13750 [Fimbriimonadaceae bacterium]|nr:hypothetical protein [Fimbriimonadaceae bacterium]
MISNDDLRRLREEKLRRLYRADPDAYARDVLDVRWWSKQAEIARLLVERGRVLVKASHGVGKTHVAGGLVNWHFDLWDPSLTITTAPTKAQVEDLLWKEVRLQRKVGREALMPASPRMQTSEDHLAVGYTARTADSFQGRHEANILVVFDEAVGVDGPFWDAAEGITSGGACKWLCIFNPTDTSSRAYEEEQSGRWGVVTVSALDHPNVLAALRGEPEPYPGAVSLGWVEEKVERWCTRLGSADPRKAGDVEWPPGSGVWHRPGPIFESRVLGRWPSQGTDTVWSEALWEAALVERPIPAQPLELGCDVARFGDDYTVIGARRGDCLIHHERHNGWSTSQTAGRLKRLARDLAERGEDPTRVAIKIDDDGVGGGVVDQAEGFRFVGLSASAVAFEPDDYPNRRSEMWFSTAKRAEEGRVDLSRLSPEARAIVRPQAMAPRWRLDAQGRRVVEPKAETKIRLRKNNPNLEGGSPDDMDMINLLFAPAPRGWGDVWTTT